MKTIKQTILLALVSTILLSFSNCGSTKMNDSIQLEETPNFSIAEVYSQDWVAGVKDGGSGTNVHITFSGLPENIAVKKVYYKDLEAEAIQNPNTTTFVAYFKNDMNPRKDIIMDADPKKEAQNTPPKKPLFTLGENEAVIMYLENGAEKYFKITQIERKPMLAYPANNNPNPLGGEGEN
ncbi:hypothetical protein [Patiriisocius hiemis]|uniref:Lipoprotein n=1 Tax=Patiriisocius hiemis TaxID=3075604 RepID=A0ABU2YCZ3_9FLAO|nr:hypothetical protein [Constantimarinum sp. W242]MDT0555539.1 hypothetical protein [Constantimarinum sp. W242]